MRKFFGIILALTFASTTYAAERPDSIATDTIPILESQSVQITISNTQNVNPESEVPQSRNWWQLLKKGKLNLSDTTVVYPKFLKFCVDVYNWGNRFFNTYDTTYVEGTGKRWKARLHNDNWTDSYSLHFKKQNTRMRMLSDINVNLGPYIQYMAVSVGYSVDINTLFGGKRTDHSRFETNFSCALFDFDLYNYHNSGTYIRQFTADNNRNFIKSYFPGISMSNFGVALYYFLNNKRYSQGAAYKFSRIQRKSAGSWLFGFTYTNLDIYMDFSTLNEDFSDNFNFYSDNFRLHYNSYCALFGYGYSWVWHPKWLYNVTVMPSIGVIQCYEDTSVGEGTQLALNIHGRMSLVFNHRALFAGANFNITGNWYTSDRLSLFNAIENFAATVGFRF